jgi:hypothetical protein
MRASVNLFALRFDLRFCQVIANAEKPRKCVDLALVERYCEPMRFIHMQL